ILGTFAPYDNLNNQIPTHQGRNTYSGSAVQWDYDGAVELDIFKNRQVISLSKSHCGLGHCLEPHDGGEEGVPLKDVIAGIGIGEHRYLGFGDQFNTWIICPCVLQKSPEGQLGPVNIDCGRIAESSRHNHGAASGAFSEEAIKCCSPLI